MKRLQTFWEMTSKNFSEGKRFFLYFLKFLSNIFMITIDWKLGSRDGLIGFKSSMIIFVKNPKTSKEKCLNTFVSQMLLTEYEI